jgi:hypothetical protein
MRPLVKILLASVVALAALIWYDGVQVDPDSFALAPSVTLSTEGWEGQTFTASDVAGITSLIARESKVLPEMTGDCPPFLVLWLGNSQLHYINQSQAGDHVAPFWLRKASACPVGTIPLGVSLPNANLQEHYVLMRYALERLPVKLVLLELCFDDLREDGLRDEFSSVLNDAERASLKQEPVGRDIVERAEAEWQHANRGEENAGLSGFAQKALEDRLDAALGAIWPLWRDRENLRVRALTDLYLLRNEALGIKPTTIRRMILAHYARNMAAFKQLLEDAQIHGVKVVAYVAPIRHDVQLPYDEMEYQRWKAEVQQLAQDKRATLINLENLVPADLWGSYVAQDVDFMHFQGKGHQLLAQALLSYLENARTEKR